MLKRFTVYLILASYFLVVLITNITSVNAVKYNIGFGIGKPYVHTPDCQQQYYLQLDCFEQCHRPVLSNIPVSPLEYYLHLLINGPDFHHLVTWLFTNTRYRIAVDLQFSPLHVFLTPGFTTLYSPPPNQI